MTLRDILQKILDEAKKEISQLEKEFEINKADLKKESDRIEKEEIAVVRQKATTASDSVEKKTRQMARRENAKTLLEAKQKLIKLAMESLASSLEKCDDNYYSEILKKCFQNMPMKSGTIFTAPSRVSITQKFIPSGFEIQATDEIAGGFIARSGKAEIDCSFKNLIFSEFSDELRAYFAENLKLL
jgi:vacuolar-type H+-ATPase subunit E/Vma4